MPIMDQSFRMSEKEIERRHKKQIKSQERFLQKHTKKNMKYCPNCKSDMHHDRIVGSTAYSRCAECGLIHNTEDIPDFMKL